MLKNELNLMLEPIQGKVLDVMVVPAFQKLIDLETEKKELEDLHLLVSANGAPGCCTRCCFGVFWTNGDVRKSAVQERLSMLEKDIESEIEKPFMSSGHAFVVLDSIKSLNFCIKQSRLTPTYAWRLAKLSIKESIAQFFSRTTYQTRVTRSISERQTFNKFEDEDLEVAQQDYRDKVDLMLVMNEASDPVDIIWCNMGGARGLYLLRVVFFNLFVLLVVLFLSTPAAIYSSLKMIQLFGHPALDIDEFTQTLGKNKEALWGWGPLISTFIPPLVIITINNCLLYMFDYFAFWEKRVTHSKYQFSILNKAYIYLALNMLVIPAVTLNSQSNSILKVISENNYNLFAILAQFYTNKDTGAFFASMIVQNACLSMCINLVRPGEIVPAFFSPWLAHYRRKYINDSQAWRRREGMVFLYGFYYAQQLAIFSIVIVFASFVPVVSITGCLFFAMRHVMDSYNLLTVNRKEIDSSTKMFQKILLTSQLAILLLLACMLSYLGMNGYMSCASLLSLVFLFSTVIVILSNKPLLDLADIDNFNLNYTQYEQSNKIFQICK